MLIYVVLKTTCKKDKNAESDLKYRMMSCFFYKTGIAKKNREVENML